MNFTMDRRRFIATFLAPIDPITRALANTPGWLISIA